MTPVLRAQTLSVIVGIVFCLWLADGRAIEVADVLLRNGKIYTADPARSIRQAIAIKGNTIVAVGDDDEVAPLIGGATTVVDLKGKLVLPGLIDTHIHPIIGAVNGAKCSLAGVKATIEALTPVVKKCLAEDQGRTDDRFEAVQLDNYGFSATAKDVDKIEAKRPLVLWGNDGHTGWVNSRGLEPSLLNGWRALRNFPFAKSLLRSIWTQSWRNFHLRKDLVNKAILASIGQVDVTVDIGPHFQSPR